MRSKIYSISLLVLSVVVLNGCSVADPTKTLSPVAGLPDAEAPAQPSSPVLVSEPMPIVAPIANAPEAIISPDQSATPPMEQAPVTNAPVESTSVETLPVEVSPIESAPVSSSSVNPVEVKEPSQSTIPEEIPEPIAIIEETPTSPAANVIDVSEVVTVTVTTSEPDPKPVTINNAEPFATTSEIALPEPAVEQTLTPAAAPMPAAIMEVAEISNPSEQLEPETATPVFEDEDEDSPGFAYSDSDDKSDKYDKSDNDDSGKNKSDREESDKKSDERDTKNLSKADLHVAGSCLGKKLAGVVWYDKRDKSKKQNTSIKCKNNKFKIKVKLKKKDLPYVEIQTLFYDR